MKTKIESINDCDSILCQSGTIGTSAAEIFVTQLGEEFKVKHSAFRGAYSIVKADLKNLRSEAELLELICKLKNNRKA